MTQFGLHGIVLAYFWTLSKKFQFQGSHIRAVLAIEKYMATLKIKFDLVLLLRKLKNPWIWILFFRVLKIWHSGLPYLQMGWGKVFQNIYFYNQQNPKYLTLQSVFTETALRLETSPSTMCLLCLGDGRSAKDRSRDHKFEFLVEQANVGPKGKEERTRAQPYISLVLPSGSIVFVLSSACPSSISRVRTQ